MKSTELLQSNGTHPPSSVSSMSSAALSDSIHNIIFYLPRKYEALNLLNHPININLSISSAITTILITKLSTVCICFILFICVRFRARIFTIMSRWIWVSNTLPTVIRGFLQLKEISAMQNPQIFSSYSLRWTYLLRNSNHRV